MSVGWMLWLKPRLSLNRRELLRLLRQETGQTPSEILNVRRLERARSLVQHPHLLLAAVAVAMGFSSRSHLTVRYREMFGVTPAVDRINNASTKPIIRKLCEQAGYVFPEICTPLELMSEDFDDV